jgi:hypothetical protein
LGFGGLAMYAKLLATHANWLASGAEPLAFKKSLRKDSSPGQKKGGRDLSEGYQYDSQNTLVGRFLKKAQKNIEAVERGEFPFGH